MSAHEYRTRVGVAPHAIGTAQEVYPVLMRGVSEEQWPERWEHEDLLSEETAKPKNKYFDGLVAP